jgi:hypothetical protein
LSKKKGKKNKPVQYQPFGDVLGVDTTFVQAAILLDKVSIGAFDTNNSELMLQVAGQWLQLGALMHATLESEEKEDHPSEGDDAGAAILGFGNTETREKAEAENRERKSKG